MNKLQKTLSGFETQKKKILKHLLTGFSITPIEALKSYGCFRLAAVVFQLKKEMQHERKFSIVCDMVSETKKGVTKRYGKYSIVRLK